MIMVFGCVRFCRIWYTRVYQNMTSNGGLAPRRLHGWLWPVEVARWLGSTLGDMNHKPMASPSMVCTFYLPCITPQNVQFGTPGCTGSCQLDTFVHGLELLVRVRRSAHGHVLEATLWCGAGSGGGQTAMRTNGYSSLTSASTPKRSQHALIHSGRKLPSVSM